MSDTHRTKARAEKRGATIDHFLYTVVKKNNAK